MISIGAILISFIWLLVEIGLIIFVAYCVVWACSFFGLTIDGNVYKWGKVVIGLICLALVVTWLVYTLSGVAMPIPHIGVAR